MDARFAGSQRLGERRRRRLAVESDDAPIDQLPAVTLTATEGTSRVAHPAPAAPPREVVSLPLERLIPSPWWAYLLGCSAGLLIGAGILAAGWYQSISSTASSAGITRLFSLPDGPIVAWYSGLALSLASQLALLIWWGRSRSLKDFDGRYRVWKQTAAAWLLIGFCAVTGTHQALAETLLRYCPIDMWRIEVLAWLVPSAGLGLMLLAALRREMADCRASRVSLIFAAACYALAAGLRLRFDVPVSQPVLDLLLAGSALLGHLGLLLSMWLHARHVLHCTQDPSRTSRRSLHIPRPHFGISRLAGGWRKKSPEVPDEQPTKTEEFSRSSRRSQRSEKPQAPVSTESTAKADPVKPVSNEPIRSQRRIDPPAAPRAMSLSPASLERQSPATQLPLTLPVRNDLAPAIETPASAVDSVNDLDNDASADDREAWTEPFAKPDMRGMSKKQRRRLMAELREKARTGRLDG